MTSLIPGCHSWSKLTCWVSSRVLYSPRHCGDGQSSHLSICPKLELMFHRKVGKWVFFFSFFLFLPQDTARGSLYLVLTSAVVATIGGFWLLTLKLLCTEVSNSNQSPALIWLKRMNMDSETLVLFNFLDGFLSSVQALLNCNQEIFYK